MKSKLGPDDPDTLVSMAGLAVAYIEAGQLEKALPLFEETLELRRTKLGPDHPDTLASMNNLAVAYSDAGQLEKSLPLYEEAFRLMAAKLGPDHPETLRSMRNLAVAYGDAGQLEKALTLVEEMAEVLEKSRLQHADYGVTIVVMTVLYEEAAQYEKAERWRRKWLEVVKEEYGPHSIEYVEELVGLGRNLLQQSKWTEAEKVLRESLECQQRLAPDDWSVYEIQSMLGEALMGQKRFTEAEPLLKAGYEGMKAEEGDLPPGARAELTQAVDRLIALYRALEKPEEVKRWQAEREALEEGFEE